MIKFRKGALTVFESALYKTTSTVIQGEDAVLIVDPCWLPHEVEEIRRYADDAAVNGKRKYVLFTHSDFDHIIGYGAFPDADVIASAAFADKDEAARAKIVEQILAFDDDYYLERQYEIRYPEVSLRVEGDGQQLQLGASGSLRLTGYHRPAIMTTVCSPWLNRLEFCWRATTGRTSSSRIFTTAASCTKPRSRSSIRCWARMTSRDSSRGMALPRRIGRR